MTLPRPDPATIDAFLKWAIDGDSRTATRFALDLLDQGVPGDEIIVDLLGGAQHEVGERWVRNVWTVADEHLVSGATQRALDAVANTVDPPNSEGLVVVACAEGDWHSLPAQMFAELLRSRGFVVAFLGASTPADHVARLLSRGGADALAVSCNLPLFFGGVTRLAEAAHRYGIPVIAGGRALGSGPARAIGLGADVWAGGIEEAAGILRGWQRQRPSSWSQPKMPDRTTIELEIETPRIAAEAFRSLMTSYPWMTDYEERQLARTREDLAFITRFVAAARLVDDPIVLTEFIGWLRTVLSNRGVPPISLRAGLEALAPILGRTDPPAGELVLEAVTSVVD